MKRVLFLDDERNPQQILGSHDSTQHVVVCRSADEAAEAVMAHPPFDRWQLDHDLGEDPAGYAGALKPQEWTS